MLFVEWMLPAGSACVNIIVSAAKYLIELN